LSWRQIPASFRLVYGSSGLFLLEDDLAAGDFVKALLVDDQFLNGSVLGLVFVEEGGVE
jgi:hypothetical protein